MHIADPTIHETAYVAPGVRIFGDVTVADFQLIAASRPIAAQPLESLIDAISSGNAVATAR